MQNIHTAKICALQAANYLQSHEPFTIRQNHKILYTFLQFTISVFQKLGFIFLFDNTMMILAFSVEKKLL